MNFIVVEKSAVNIFNLIRILFDVWEGLIGINLKLSDAILENGTENNTTNILHIIGDERINFWLLNRCVVITVVILLPRLTIATITTAAAESGITDCLNKFNIILRKTYDVDILYLWLR